MRGNPLSYVRLTPAERVVRDELQRMLQASAVMRATLTVRERVCGKENCKCATGEKHSSLYIVSRQNGELRQLFVPKHLEAKARQWVKNYLYVQKLLEKVSDSYWRRLEQREE
ncbi:MAG: DUF6788 family protein [Nitrososphaerales archaeon]